MTYIEKLQDPRWQKIRLLTLDRDEFTCQLCDDKETTLHVHHLKYPASRNPWDVTVQDVITYCKHCHSLVEFKYIKSPILGVLKTPIQSSGIKLEVLYFNHYSIESFVYLKDGTFHHTASTPFHSTTAFLSYIQLLTDIGEYTPPQTEKIYL